MIPEATLDAIRDRIAIDQVFGERGVKLRRQGRSYMAPCPFHGNRSASLSVSPERGLFRCFGCDAAGDAFKAVQLLDGVLFRDAVRLLARDAGVDIEDASGANPRPSPRVRVVRADAVPEHPTSDRLDELARWCVPVTDDEAIAGYLRSRSIDPIAVADRRLAFALRVDVPEAALPKHKPGGAAGDRVVTWIESGHRLIVPLFDAQGILRNVVARSIEAPRYPDRKTTKHGTSRGLVMACSLGRMLLEHATRPEWWGAHEPLRVVVAEGEIDLLTWATEQSDANEDAYASLGIMAGSWTDAIAARIPDGSVVVIATDSDQQGERYAAHVHATLNSRQRRNMIEVARWSQ